jgi:hypothetical protein
MFFPIKYITTPYKRATREIIRLSSVMHSPILSHFQESLAGAKFIRAFKKNEQFIAKNERILNVSARLEYSLQGCHM